MTVSDTDTFISILLQGGTYYYEHESNTVVIVDDFTGLDSMIYPVFKATRNAGCTFIAVPTIHEATYNESPLNEFINAFLQRNIAPSFMLCTRVYPGLIMDDDIILVKNNVIDHGNILKKISSAEFEWLKIKNEETENNSVSIINNHVQREWKLLIGELIVNENAMDRLSELLSSLRNDFKRKEEII